MSSFKKGRVYEDSIAKDFKGKRQPMSGSHFSAKEDVTGGEEFSDFLIQTKNSSGNKSHSISREALRELRINSSKSGKTGLYVINFGDKEEYVVMRKQDFLFYFGKED